MPQRHISHTELAHLAHLASAKLDPALLALASGQFENFLARVGSSAQRQKGPDGQALLRWQDALIEQDIPAGASVLDLGCGDGELLSRLIQGKKVSGQGVECDPDSVLGCVGRGVPVFQADLDQGLGGFPEKRFDYVILEETLQTLKRPDEMLNEMLRVGKSGIVSFPNFAYWRVRLDLGVRGRMPVTEYLPYRWYDTPNIHLFTLQDFLEWADENKVVVTKGYVLAEGQVRPLQPGDNLYAEEALLTLQKA